MKQLTREHIAALATIDTPTICNAIEYFKVRPLTEGFMGMRIRCMFPELGVMVGYAVTTTIDCSSPVNEPVPGANARWLEAIQESPQPTVMISKDVGPNPDKSAHVGDERIGAAMRLGMVGLVTDGGVRDVEQVRKLGFHYFAPGAVPSHGTNVIKDVSIPVEIDGVKINPGDLIHGDINGVTVIPHEIADRVYEVGVQVREKEFNRYLKYLKGPEISLEGLREMFPDQ